MLLTIEEATIGFVKAIGEDEGSCVRCFFYFKISLPSLIRRFINRRLSNAYS